MKILLHEEEGGDDQTEYECQFYMASTSLDSSNLSPSRLNQGQINTLLEKKNYIY